MTLASNLTAMYWAQQRMAPPAGLGYVTDGLVAMWDGEYNLGHQHSGTSDVWVDMVGGVELQYIGDETYEWLDKCCHFLGTSGYGCFYGVTGGTESSQKVGTLEVARSWETVTGSSANAAPASNVYSGAFRVRRPKLDATGLPTLNIYTPRHQRVATKFAAAAKTIHTDAAVSSSTSAPEQTFTAWQDAIQATQYSDFTISQDITTEYIGSHHLPAAASGQGGAARVYCVRRYNRALTQAELMQNYLVDKARFGTSYA